MKSLRKSIAKIVPGGVASAKFKATLQTFINTEPQRSREALNCAF